MTGSTLGQKRNRIAFEDVAAMMAEYHEQRALGPPPVGAETKDFVAWAFEHYKMSKATSYRWLNRAIKDGVIEAGPTSGFFVIKA